MPSDVCVQMDGITAAVMNIGMQAAADRADFAIAAVKQNQQAQQAMVSLISTASAGPVYNAGGNVAASAAGEVLNAKG